MFPIIRSDINNVYVTKGVKAKIRKDDFQDLERTVSSILASPNTLRHVTNINAPMLLEMAQRRFQIEQNRASRTNAAENTKGIPYLFVNFIVIDNKISTLNKVS